MTSPPKSEATKLMQAVLRKAHGKVEVTLTETGEFYARAYLPTHEIASRVADHIRANNLAPSQAEYVTLSEEIAARPIAQGSGRTAEEALQGIRAALPRG